MQEPQTPVKGIRKQAQKQGNEKKWNACQCDKDKKNKTY
jgi:hypothetical protein